MRERGTVSLKRSRTVKYSLHMFKIRKHQIYPSNKPYEIKRKSNPELQFVIFTHPYAVLITL